MHFSCGLKIWLNTNTRILPVLDQKTMKMTTEEFMQALYLVQICRAFKIIYFAVNTVLMREYTATLPNFANNASRWPVCHCSR